MKLSINGKVVDIPGGSTDYMTVEKGDERYCQKTGGTITGPLNVPTPTEDSQVANKQYVDEHGKEVYSTEETVIGTWIDGKPIYRKIYNIESIKSNEWSFTNNIVKNLDYCCKINGIVYNLPSYTKTSFVSVPGVNSNVGLSIDYKPGIYVTESSYNGCQAYLIVEYTKTTDTATIDLPSTLSLRLDSELNEGIVSVDSIASTATNID